MFNTSSTTVSAELPQSTRSRASSPDVRCPCRAHASGLTSPAARSRWRPAPADRCASGCNRKGHHLESHGEIPWKNLQFEAARKMVAHQKKIRRWPAHTSHLRIWFGQKFQDHWNQKRSGSLGSKASTLGHKFGPAVPWAKSPNKMSIYWKIIELNGAFSSKPCLITRAYPSSFHTNPNWTLMLRMHIILKVLEFLICSTISRYLKKMLSKPAQYSMTK